VYAASEGLDTVVVERHAPGGQAGTSARIENFPGFPHGVTGKELAEAAYAQALRFGAEIVVGADMVQARREPHGRIGITLVNGSRVRARAAIGAPGVRYRRLDAPGVEELLGSGIYYGSAVGEAAFHRGGTVFIVGGANSAGQAALHLAQYAASVTLVVRGESLEERMSRYLVERLQEHPSISVWTRAAVVRAIGEARLEQLVIADHAADEERTVAADALFIMIGGIPVSDRVDGWLRRDDHGFMVTGADVLDGDVHRRWWPLEREPYMLEGSQPGVFIIGDARRGSVKRVASAVGEAAIAVQLVHRYLAAAREL
jgi:thioredoxin reductase (NADPH)